MSIKHCKINSSKYFPNTWNVSYYAPIVYREQFIIPISWKTFVLVAINLNVPPSWRFTQSKFQIVEEFALILLMKCNRL